MTARSASIAARRLAVEQLADAVAFIAARLFFYRGHWMSFRRFLDKSGRAGAWDRRSYNGIA